MPFPVNPRSLLLGKLSHSKPKGLAPEQAAGYRGRTLEY